MRKSFGFEVGACGWVRGMSETESGNDEMAQVIGVDRKEVVVGRYLLDRVLFEKRGSGTGRRQFVWDDRPIHSKRVRCSRQRWSGGVESHGW